MGLVLGLICGRVIRPGSPHKDNGQNVFEKNTRELVFTVCDFEDFRYKPFITTMMLIPSHS